jgi:hypothetical protein
MGAFQFGGAWCRFGLWPDDLRLRHAVTPEP